MKDKPKVFISLNYDNEGHRGRVLAPIGGLRDAGTNNQAILVTWERFNEAFVPLKQNGTFYRGPRMRPTPPRCPPPGTDTNRSLNCSRPGPSAKAGWRRKAQMKLAEPLSSQGALHMWKAALAVGIWRVALDAFDPGPNTNPSRGRYRDGGRVLERPPQPRRCFQTAATLDLISPNYLENLRRGRRPLFSSHWHLLEPP